MYVPMDGEVVVVQWDQGGESVEVVDHVELGEAIVYDSADQCFKQINFMSLRPLQIRNK